jgi:calcineurin-like phosphoesterase
MRLLFCGDVMGRSGRDVVKAELPRLRDALSIDFAVVNGENAAHGFGMTPDICNDLFEAGADVITGGNHTYDKAEIIPSMEADRRLLRPANYPPGTPTADARVLDNGTAYHTDAGMCGDYNSVIGMKAELSIRTFERRFPRERMSPADGPGTLCGTFVETDPKTGLATRVEPVRVGGTLPPYMPSVD